MDVFSENLRRHLAREGRGVGGPYGKAAEPVLGWSPSAPLLFFDDYVQVRKDAPDTNFYGTGSAQCDSGSTNWQREVVIKTPQPFFRPRFIDLGYGSMESQVYNATGTYSWGVSVYLLRKPLGNDPVPPPAVPNPWSLNKLTYNMIGRNPAGTFWSDAANYYYLGQLMSNACGGIAGQYTSSQGLLSLGINFFSVGNLATLDAAAPFYGIHLSMLAEAPIITAIMTAPVLGSFGAFVAASNIYNG